MPIPKRYIAFAFAAGALALAACNNSNINNLYGTPTPNPTTTPTFTPNPQASTATIVVTYQGSPLPNQPIALSTPGADGHAGTPILSQMTDSTGKTTFSNLTPQATYCFSSTYQPPASPPPTPLPEYQSYCNNLWGTYNINFNF